MLAFLRRWSKRPASDGAPSSEGRALRRLAIRGSLFELAGYAGNIGLRVISSIVLRRLLSPEIMGLNLILDGLSLGLVLLSDVGIQQAVVQSARGDEPVFLDTAWSIHVVRGWLLWVLACLLALPLAWAAGEPAFVWLVPLHSFSIVLMGFGSTAEFTLRRRLLPGRIVRNDLIAQLAMLAVSTTWASHDPSVRALVAGGVTSAAVRTALTYVLARDVGRRDRFRWDSQARREIFEFGKWITASSAVFFVSSWGDRLLVVAMLGTDTAGVYATAILVAEAVGNALDRVIHGVFYPLFARVGREGLDALRVVYYQTRLRFDALTLIATGVLAMTGPWVIGLFYDERYQAAGWMLRVLCVRSATLCVVAPAETCLTSLGHTRYGFYQNVARALWVLVAVPVGHALGGVQGVVWAVALAGVPPLFVVWL